MSEISDAQLNHIVRQTNSQAKKPRASLSATLQILRDRGELISVRPGIYRKNTAADNEFLALAEMVEHAEWNSFVPRDNTTPRESRKRTAELAEIIPLEQLDPLMVVDESQMDESQETCSPEPSPELSPEPSPEPSPTEARTYKKQSIPKPLRRKIWRNHFGLSMVGKCFCCQHTLDYDDNYECGHRFAESLGGQTIESNLLPICRQCNRSMGTTSIEDFTKKFRPRNLIYNDIQIECIMLVIAEHCITKLQNQTIVGQFLEIMDAELLDYSRVGRSDLTILAHYFHQLRQMRKAKFIHLCAAILKKMRKYLEEMRETECEV